MLDLLLADVSGGMHSGMPSSLRLYSCESPIYTQLYVCTQQLIRPVNDKYCQLKMLSDGIDSIFFKYSSIKVQNKAHRRLTQVTAAMP